MKQYMAAKARRRPRSVILAAFATATAFAASQATAMLVQGAQQQTAAVENIAVGETKTGSFAGIASDTGTTPFHEYRLELAEGRSIIIKMNSPDPAAVLAPIPPATAQSGFDTYLELRAENDQTALRTDDDGGPGLNSRISFTAPTAGTYIIRARPLNSVYEEQSPTYQLTVEAQTPPPPPREFTFPTAEGDLGPGSPEDETYELVRYAEYWFQGRSSERIQFDMRTDILNPSLQIVDPNGAVLAVGSGFDSNNVRLIASTPAEGRFLVRVQIPAEQSGHYSLTATRAMPPGFQEPETIEIGESAQGELSLGSAANTRTDGTGQIEYFYELFEVPVRRGESITVSLTAQGFDPMLEAGTTSVLGFVPVLSEIDMAEGRSQLVIQPLETGKASLRVRSQGSEGGSFQLSINRTNAQ